ncbi:hypothetical protein ACKUT9_23095 [Mycobacterium seoulense]|uniref:hypothetical protein n=1 Tax=Mycobacterium seoulense TaxID=386911 RepID=UPI003CED4951
MTEPPFQVVGEPITIANEFAEVRVSRVQNRNGARLLIESNKSGHQVLLCPLELEALTWQSTATFSAMIGRPYGSLLADACADPSTEQA